MLKGIDPLLSGDLRPDSGTVRIDGAPLDHWTANELAVRRGVLLQQSNVSFPFTVTQIVRMGRAPWSGTQADDWDDHVVAQVALLVCVFVEVEFVGIALVFGVDQLKLLAGLLDLCDQLVSRRRQLRNRAFVFRGGREKAFLPRAGLGGEIPMESFR